jgi:hypothetical protein
MIRASAFLLVLRPCLRRRIQPQTPLHIPPRSQLKCATTGRAYHVPEFLVKTAINVIRQLHPHPCQPSLPQTRQRPPRQQTPRLNQRVTAVLICTRARGYALTVQQADLAMILLHKPQAAVLAPHTPRRRVSPTTGFASASVHQDFIKQVLLSHMHATCALQASFSPAGGKTPASCAPPASPPSMCPTPTLKAASQAALFFAEMRVARRSCLHQARRCSPPRYRPRIRL